MLFLLLIGLVVVGSEEFFAGNGLEVNCYTFDNQEFSYECYSYDDCYMLLCYFLSDPSYGLITFQPYQWDGDCDNLTATDGRIIEANIICLDNNDTVVYDTFNMSFTSKLLCMLRNDPNVSDISYFYISC